MDIVGSLGYTGQKLVAIGSDKFGFSNGSAVVQINETGPFNMITRLSTGVSCVESHHAPYTIAIAPDANAAPIEIIDGLNNAPKTKLENPTYTKIIALSFSFDGERLIGLSDETDHKVIMWDIAGNKILFTHELSAICTSVLFNPGDLNLVAMYGANGLFIGRISELLEEYSMRVEKIEIESSGQAEQISVDDQADLEHFSEEMALVNNANNIGFVCWAPNNVIYMGTAEGCLLHCNVATRAIKNFAWLNIAVGSKASIPSCGVLTEAYLVVGAQDGAVSWFPLEQLVALNADAKTKVKADSGVLDPLDGDIVEPVQSSHLSRNGNPIDRLTTMAINGQYGSMIAGSQCGSLFKIPMEVKVTAKVSEDEDGLDVDEVSNTMDGLAQAKGSVVTIECEPLCDLQDGAVLCSSALFVPVLVLQDGFPTKHFSSTLSVFLTGSHDGCVSCWQAPAAGSDTEHVNLSHVNSSVGDAALRRALPKPLKMMAREYLEASIMPEEGAPESSPATPAVTTMEVLSMAAAFGGRLVAIGSSDGWLEVWLVQAFESLEEEEGADQNADEGSLFKLQITKVMRRHLFDSTICMISSCVIKPLTVVISYASSEIYVLNSVNTAHFDVVSRLILPTDEDEANGAVNVTESGWRPVGCCWKEASLWIMCANGQVLMYQNVMDPKSHLASAKFNYLSSPLQAGSYWNATPIDYGSVGTCTFHANGTFALLSSADTSNITVLSQLPLTTPILPMSAEMMELDILSTLGSFSESFEELSDTVLCSAVSLNGAFMAFGCSDGTVHNYKVESKKIMVEGEQVDEKKFKLLNRVQLHRSAVLSMSYSVDSSMLLSAGVDGTVFICALDKISVPRSDPVPKYVLGKLDDSDLVRFISAEKRSQVFFDLEEKKKHLWIDVKKEESKLAEKNQYKNSLAEIKKSIESLSDRLKTLLVANDEAQDLEKLERSEFVVDVYGEIAAVEHNENEVAKLRNEYEIRVLQNELIAARIRQSCWDSMQVQSVKIMPIQPSALPEGNALAKHGVTAFSVESTAERDMTNLERVKVMRAIELKTLKAHSGGKISFVSSGNARCCWNTAVAASSASLNWMAYDGNRWPCADVIKMILERDQKEADAVKAPAGGAAGAPAAGIPSVVDNDFDDDNSLTGIDNNAKEFDENNIFNLLYPPTAVRTQIQKRSQIILLKEVSKKIRLKFNEHFDKLVNEKEDVVSSVESRNNRIVEIMNELHIHEDYLKPTRVDEENRGSAIVVNDDEIVSRPYENEAARALKEKLAEEKRLRDLEKSKDDIMGRALDDMMHGTLEVKRDVFAEVSALHKPEWMENLSPDSYSESQKKEAEEFELKLKTLQEEQVKYRKSLEQELKKLKQEAVDSSKVFDEKILWIARLKLLTQKELLALELYLARLSLSMAKKDQSWHNLKNAENELEETRRVRLKLREKMDNYAVKVNNAKDCLQIAQEACVIMDKGFKRDIQTLCGDTFDQEQLKIFTQLYRKRHYAEDESGGLDADESELEAPANGGQSAAAGAKSSKASSRARKQNSSQRSSKAKKLGTSRNVSSNVADELGPMQKAAQNITEASLGTEQEGGKEAFNEHDPFYVTRIQMERQKRILENQIPILVPLSLELDCPEVLSANQYQWSKLQELRNNRIYKEIEYKTLSLEFAEMKKKLEDLTVQEAYVGNQMNKLRSQREDILRYSGKLDSDLELLIAIRQGQDEVDKDAVVTDYGDAMLLPIQVMDKYNSRILELGKDKIAVLAKIKHFRRKINLIDWEANHMQLQARHLEEYYTDLQLFRVTRDLQQVIRDGNNASKAEATKERVDKVGIRKEFLAKDSEMRVNKMRKFNEDLARQEEERAVENKKLEAKIHDLRKQVEARNVVQQSRAQARGADGDARFLATQKMKKVVARRQLVDTARAQAEEVDFLRQELDRMRQKTFPSFVRATRTRLTTNPDDRLN